MKLRHIAVAAALAGQAAGAAAPAGADQSVALLEAWLVEDGFGDVIVYVARDFLLSAPAEPSPLLVVTLERSNAGHAANSVKNDVNRLHQYLKEHSSYEARDLVAVASSRDVIRVYFHNRDLDAVVFGLSRASLAVATEQDWRRLRSIGIADFARDLAKQGTLQADSARQLFGDQVPPPEERTINVALRLRTSDVAQGNAFDALIAEQPFKTLAASVTSTAAADHLDVMAKMRFSEAAVEQWVNGVCALGQSNGTPCSVWRAQFDPVTIDIAGQATPLRSGPIPQS